MVHILLLILKIIGCLLLFILFLLLLVLLLVLLVPVRYQFAGEKMENKTPEGQVEVTWLFSLIRFTGTFRDWAFNYKLRAAWFTLMDSSQEETGEDSDQTQEIGDDLIKEESAVSDKEAGSDDPSLQEKKEETVQEPQKEASVSEEVREEASVSEEIREETPEEASVSEEIQEETPEEASVGEEVREETPEEASVGEEVREETPEEVSEQAEMEQTPQVETSKADDLVEETHEEVQAAEEVPPEPLVDRFFDIADQIQEWLEVRIEYLDRKQQQVEEILETFPPDVYYPIARDTVYKVILHVIPQKMEGLLHYGFEDGYTTGRICSWTACFYPIYADSLDLVPDFDRQVLEGNLKGRGRIRLGFFVRLLIWLLLKKEVRFAICYLLKLRKKPRQASKEPKTA